MSTKKRHHFRHFILWGGVLFPALMAITMTLFSFIFAPGEKFFFNLAAAMIVSWTLMLTLYYIWAIYFYNIRRGQTDKECDANIRMADFDGKPGHRMFNPNAEETLGLPPGTVRGTLALSVLVVAMAMMIASLAMPGATKDNEIRIDHFEFLKTGFVMVIAFYFGTKSLQILQQKKGPAAADLSSASPSIASADEANHPQAGDQQPLNTNEV